MNDAADTELLTLAADPKREVWGVLCPPRQRQWWVTPELPAAGGEARAAVLELGPAEPPAATLPLAATQDAGAALCFAATASEIELAGHRQPVRLATLSYRGPQLQQRDSLRLLAFWLPEQLRYGFAARRSKDRDADRDEVAVLAAGEQRPLVNDPRLSSTLDGDGVPRRCAIELWLSDEPDGDLYPRRVSGLRCGDPLRTTVGEHRLTVCPLQVRRHDDEGFGLFALLRPAAS